MNATNKDAHCGDHSGNCAKIERAESDIQGIWKAIDSMKAWVIVGMASMIVQLGFKLLDLVGRINADKVVGQ